MQTEHLSKILKQVALSDCVRIQDGGYLLKRARGRLLAAGHVTDAWFVHFVQNQ